MKYRKSYSIFTHRRDILNSSFANIVWYLNSGDLQNGRLCDEDARRWKHAWKAHR